MCYFIDVVYLRLPYCPSSLSTVFAFPPISFFFAFYICQCCFSFFAVSCITFSPFVLSLFFFSCSSLFFYYFSHFSLPVPRSWFPSASGEVLLPLCLYWTDTTTLQGCSAFDFIFKPRKWQVDINLPTKLLGWH